jgi:hypothetical protein
MTAPTICVLIPTVGRPSLARMLQSMREQDLAAGDEVLLVSDDHHDDAAATWAAAGLPGRHVPLSDGPHRDWGHTPRNRAHALVRAHYLLHADDDDVLLPGALARVRGALRDHPKDFHLFPFVRHRDRHLVGSERVLAHGHIGTPNLVHPIGIPLGRWGTAHGGDAAFITGTIALNPELAIHWHTEPHYYAYPPADFTLADCYAAGYRVARARVAEFRLLPAKPVWVDLAHRGGGVGREDCQEGWHALAARLFAGRDLLDVGAGLGYSRARLAPAARRLRLQDPGTGLPVDLACPVSDIPARDSEVVTAFDVLEHVEDDRGFVESLLRIASDAVFLTTPNWLVSRAANPHHCREYTPSQLLALLDGLPVAELWAGNPRGTTLQRLERTEFARHTSPHQAVLLRH